MTPTSTLPRAIRSILCAVDFSPQSRPAILAAAALAERFGAHITVLFVDDPLLSQAVRMRFDAQAVGQAAEAELRRFTERALGRRSSDLRNRAIAYAIVSGPPAGEICRAVARVSADLVVMGTRGLSGAKQVIIGSTAEAVLTKTQVPTLVVSPAAARLVRGRRWPGRKIVAAIDLGAHALTDTRLAARVARTFGASLALVHVVQPRLGPPWLRLRLQDDDRARLAQARGRLRTLAAAVTGVRVATRVLRGDPADEIAAVALASRAGLTVLLLRPGRGLFGPLTGSITYRVLAGTATPVLVVPAPA